LAGLAVSARYRFTTLKKSEVPETAGLYVLYKEEPLEVFYVGKATVRGKPSKNCDGLRFRIMENHLGRRGDDNFVKYIREQFECSTREEACRYIHNECSVSWMEVNDPHKLFVLEHLAIAAMRPRFNRG